MELWDSVIRMVSALAVVLGLMGLLIVLIRRLNLKGVLEPVDAPVRVLASGYLGSRKSIVVVSVAGECLILGATANDLVPLGRLEKPEQINRLINAPPVVDGAQGMTVRSVARFLSGRPASGVPRQTHNEGADR